MFYSILFPSREQQENPRRAYAPAFFEDLNLNQVFDLILSRNKAFDLGTYFYTSLTDTEIIAYRQSVMRELENDELRLMLHDFSKQIYRISQNMNAIRSNSTSQDDWQNNVLTKGKMLNYAQRYCQAVFSLREDLVKTQLKSAGLVAFRQYLEQYTASEAYLGLRNGIKKLRDEFSRVQYCMLVKGGTVKVRKYEGQPDHSYEILKVFEKFRQGDVKNYRRKIREEPYAEHVEAAVLEMLQGLYKDEFLHLQQFCSDYLCFDDEIITRFSQEIQFYLSWLDFIEPIKKAGLPFCYPKMSATKEHLYILGGYDLALAEVKYGNTVMNDFGLKAPEQIMVVTGPNQGGKTTFARFFGQSHYFASLGLSVPGSEAALYLFDNIFTHFGREEDLSTLQGKLKDDLVRLKELLDKASVQSLIIINEIFSSTTLTDALFLGVKMMDKISAIGCPAVIVTFLDKLACHGDETVSMSGLNAPDDPAIRTFRIVRKPPDGLAYAMQIAQKHSLTYNQLCERLRK